MWEIWISALGTVAFFAVIVNVAMHGLFAFKLYKTLSATVFFDKYIGKALLTFLAGAALAIQFHQDLFAMVVEHHHNTILGELLTGLVIGGGSNSIHLIVKQLAGFKDIMKGIGPPKEDK